MLFVVEISFLQRYLPSLLILLLELSVLLPHFDAA